MIYLDTHVVVWLYLADMSKFSVPAKTAINTHELKISPRVNLSPRNQPFEAYCRGYP